MNHAKLPEKIPKITICQSSAKRKTGFLWMQAAVNIRFEMVEPGANWSIVYTIDPPVTADTIKKF